MSLECNLFSINHFCCGHYRFAEMNIPLLLAHLSLKWNNTCCVSMSCGATLENQQIFPIVTLCVEKLEALRTLHIFSQFSSHKWENGIQLDDIGVPLFWLFSNVQWWGVFLKQITYPWYSFSINFFNDSQKIVKNMKNVAKDTIHSNVHYSITSCRISIK